MNFLNALKNGIARLWSGYWFRSVARHLSFSSLKKKTLLKLPSPIPSEPKQVIKQDQHHACPQYKDLKMHFRDIGRMNGIIEALGRDFLTAMPEGAYKSRLGQIGFLSRRMHQDLANETLVGLIEKAQEHQQHYPAEWDAWDSANLHEMARMYRHYCNVPSHLMERRAHLSYEGRRQHRAVLKANDWESAKGFLQEMIDLQCRIAESKARSEDSHPTEPLYETLMQEYIPDMRLDDVDKIFKSYEEKINILLPQILEAQKTRETPLPLSGPFAPDLQLWLNKSLLNVIGFDFKRGGLYETGHNPVEGGTPDDTRLVIKTSDTENFLESMKSTLHEGGHGLYIQGLPRTQWRYQPVGQDLGAAVQESQALLIEMILARTPEFFDYLAPRVEGLFQKLGDPAMSAQNLHALKTKVSLTIDRKNADEATYFYHINMRMKLERKLINRTLKVKDLPDAWNAEVKKFTGKEPSTNAQGCLQDVHWFVGKFGYYPAYSLGHMMAAQLNATMKRDIQNLPELIAAGDFAPITKWLNTHIHGQGRLQKTNQLLQSVTGKPLNSNALIHHLEDRYLRAA